MLPYEAVNDAIERWQQSRRLPKWIIPKYVYMAKIFWDMGNPFPLPKCFGPPMLGGCIVKLDKRLKEPICYVKDGPMLDWKKGRELPKEWTLADDYDDA